MKMTFLRTLVTRSARRHSSKWAGPVYLRKPRRVRDMQLVIRQIHALTLANAPLVPGLESAAADAPSECVEAVLVALSRDIGEGMSLSESMRRLSRFFPRVYADMVGAAEVSGHMGETLGFIDAHIGRAMELPRIARDYACYVLSVAMISTLIFIFMGYKVFPHIIDLIGEFRADGFGSIELPALFRVMSRIMDFLSVTPSRAFMAILSVPILYVILRLAAMSWKRLRVNSSGVGLLFAKGLDRLPVFRVTRRRMHMANALQTLHGLIQAGVPLKEALDRVSEMELEPLLRERIRLLSSQVEQGVSLHEAMGRESGYWPEDVRVMAALGHESGMLPELLARIASYYEAEVRKTLRICLEVTAPVCILCLGGFVLVFNSSIFMVLISIVEALGSGI